MNRLLIIIIFFGIFVIGQGMPCPYRTAEAQGSWLEVKGDHFIVYYAQGFKDFAKEVLREAEKDYVSLANYLGYARYSNFWTWDNRVKIYIYPDRDSYLKSTGEPEWSEGVATYNTKQIISYAWSRNFLEFLLPHEMTHLMFRDFVGFKGEVPLWLDEGVAQWAELKRRQQIKLQMKALIRRGSLISLKDMMVVDLSKRSDLVGLYYLQAASLVGFLIEKFGTDDFTVFCRELCEGKSLEDALRAAYPRNIETLEDLEKQWLEYFRGGVI